ncbi:hypothetical protein PFISCL1PPCAC_19991 [Pristionchus fissidentatus]|uniref:6-pyruvoyltetrahydropterin synthase n=1 Tax=Pristionchus fissidentatus TaxID=1538716 RepID=A0AAV5WD85_9BILA|nr:hypothetical protein PFISCL1PPCAC_19991 [Pristionchus fissidentatus]
MAFTMERRETFSSAHRLHSAAMSDEDNAKIYGKCNNANGHGHNYVWRVVLKGDIDSKTGMLYDLGALKREMADVLEMVDHKHLDKDVDYFRTVTESMGQMLTYVFYMFILASIHMDQQKASVVGKGAFHIREPCEIPVRIYQNQIGKTSTSKGVYSA